ncbi:MAG: SDR family NAD(P)-dependent oxidoreductase [Leptotrichiaceae bacterium]|nr:SDR family NAD(P)-dependent oxidoreductase [Leptotrichiaceae bacterium]MBP6281106.1 SDR family NAD(P)-dependent oxidoreductase [Leptotrichiaceae bacterium]MBP7101238.1 SDR family NAD(P)-dependent oxidoreductase [Leptotrichiaceae bacterium]MBP7739283.1 SDR family NAD(P)-dependent oxidoreductase [Leptotrichiaceae bacterium]MBP9628989.1 SDR family NAD(P)-dependent oxidoreductase [Leptotrichiaceae bacterium]
MENIKKILITGGAGFIGSHIADRFDEEGYEIIIVDNLVGGKEDNIKHLKNYKFYNVDIRNREELEKVFSENKNILYVFHEAAQVSVSVSINDVYYDADENIIGLINVLDMCRKYEVKKILFAGTAAAYGIPESSVSKENSKISPIAPYGLSKVFGEHYIRMYNSLFGLNYVIFRYSNVYGPRQSAHGEAGVVSIFNDKIRADEEVFIDGDGEQTRDFIYVKDVANANYLAAVENSVNITMNVSTNEKTSINELFNTMKKYLGYKKDVNYRSPRVGDIRDSKLDNTLLKTNTSWNYKYSLDDGLKEYSEFQKK